MKSISSIEAKFLRFKLTTNFTHLWENLDHKKKKIFLDNVELLDDEKITLGFYPDSLSYYWMLTNKRLIVRDKLDVMYFLLPYVNLLSPKDVFPNGVIFENIDNIKIIYHNRYYEILIESGTWHAIYSIFVFILSE